MQKTYGKFFQRSNWYTKGSGLKNRKKGLKMTLPAPEHPTGKFMQKPP
jgi:hypothetical protein